jgi:ArsR family transcriptional regulator
VRLATVQSEELNSTLQLLENPVRRRIIKRLSRGPGYPLQLSKELGLGQPLVARHLALMEKAGLVTSSMEESPGAPDRRSYTLAKSISITLDVAPNLFIQRGFTFGTMKGKAISDEASSLIVDVSEVSRKKEEGAISSLSSILEKIDGRLDAIEEERAALLYVRNLAMSTASEAVRSLEGEDRKRVIYNVLEEHTRDVEDISESLDLRESVVRNILKDLRGILE